MRVEILDLEMHRRPEQSQECRACYQRGPQNLLPRRLAERDSRHDPAAAHNPRSSPMIRMNRSSREAFSAVNEYTSAPEAVRYRIISGSASLDFALRVNCSPSRLAVVVHFFRPASASFEVF